MNEILTKKTVRIKRICITGLQIGAGAVLANISVAGLFSPFGLAFASVFPLPGALGAAIGYILSNRDPIRYTVAVASVCVLKKILNVSVGKKTGTDVFAALLSVWATILGSVSGIFIPGNDLRTSLLFIVGGGVSAIASFVLAASLKTSDTPTKKQAVCFCVTASLLTVGIISGGGFMVHAGIILAVTSVFFICAKCGLYNVCMYSLILGLTLFLYDREYIVFFAILTLGAIGGSLVRNYGKYAVIVCFVLANTAFSIYFAGEYKTFPLLFDILAAGILFILFPMSRISQILNKTAPFPTAHISGRIKAMKKRPGIFAKIKRPSEKNPFYKICDKCGKRLVCWIKDYDYTLDTLNKMSAEVGSDTMTVPTHFKRKCPNFDKIVRKLRTEDRGQPSWTVTYSKASRPKRGQIVCADSCGIFTSVDGKQILSLADGMGTGSAAAKQSIKAIKLLQRLLSNGIERADAVRLLNDSFIRNDEETVVGVDICIIDLFSGRCEFIKAGGAVSYIIRDGNVYTIGTASTPIGILDEVDLVTHKATLCDGDMIIMASDGLTASGSEWLISALQTMAKRHITDCVTATQAILRHAVDHDRTDDDDISVIAAYVTLDPNAPCDADLSGETREIDP